MTEQPKTSERVTDSDDLGTDPPTGAVSTGTSMTEKDEKPLGLLAEAWRDLRRRPMFIAASTIIAVLVLIALFPWLFTGADPVSQTLSKARQGPSAEAWFGYDQFGRDIYARVIYGARASIIVGALATVLTIVLGSVVGLITGYFGGKTDALLSRFAEVFLGLPFVLGAIVILTVFSSGKSTVLIMTQVIVTIGVLAWPISMRIMRSAAIASKQQDYVKAAKSMGASHSRIIVKHVLPNSLAPVMVYATIALGTFIGLEATLSYLGLGLHYPVISWGIMISGAEQYISVAPHMLMFPAGALIITVLAFVMLGDAVRDALDPKQS